MVLTPALEQTRPLLSGAGVLILFSQNLLDLLGRFFDILAQGHLLESADMGAGFGAGDEHQAGVALAHGGGHGGGDFPQHSAGDEDADGPGDDIRPAAALYHGV